MRGPKGQEVPLLKYTNDKKNNKINNNNNKHNVTKKRRRGGAHIVFSARGGGAEFEVTPLLGVLSVIQVNSSKRQSIPSDEHRHDAKPMRRT